MQDFDRIAEQYISAWNETDEDKRKVAVAQLWAPEGRYVGASTAITIRLGSSGNSARSTA